MKVNLIPAPWCIPPRKQADLLSSDFEYQVADISSKWNGSYTTIRELKEQGFTHAQIRYGKNNTKVWYGELK